jgi:O-antigen/teichoic acid export membrane protein
MILVKMGDTAMAGRLELGRAIAIPLIAITALQLRDIQVTDARDEYSFADYLGTRLAMIVLSIFAFIVISWCWYSGETAWVILLWGLAMSIQSVSGIAIGLFQKHECMNLSGTSMIIKGLGSMAIAGVLIWLTKQLIVAIVGVICVYLLVLFLYDFPQSYRLLAYKSSNGIRCRMLPHFSVKVLLALLWLSLPLGIVMFLEALQASVPKLVLESYRGEVALGYFGPILYPILLGMVVVCAMGQSALPRLAKYYVNNLASYCRLLGKLLLMALVMGLLLILSVVLFGKFVLTILYKADYANYYSEFVILAIGGTAGFMASFCGYGLVSARLFKLKLFVGMVGFLVVTILAFLLIPSYGLRGAAITFGSALFVMLICYFFTLLWVIRRRQKELNLQSITP